MKIIKAYLVDQDSEFQESMGEAFGVMEKVDGFPVGLVYYKDHKGKNLRHTSFVIFRTKENAELVADLLNASKPNETA